jgi:hypothetical protein
VRAPQYRRVGPNPAASRGLRVRPFANIFALVESLGVISLHRTEQEAKTALEAELERRKKTFKPGEGAPAGDSPNR